MKQRRKQNWRDRDIVAKPDFIVVGVSSCWITGNRSTKHVRAKKYPHVFGYKADGSFISFRIPDWQIPLYKKLVRCINVRICLRCGKKFKALEKRQTLCFVCNSSMPRR